MVFLGSFSKLASLILPAVVLFSVFPVSFFPITPFRGRVAGKCLEESCERGSFHLLKQYIKVFSLFFSIIHTCLPNKYQIVFCFLGHLAVRLNIFLKHLSLVVLVTFGFVVVGLLEKHSCFWFLGGQYLHPEEYKLRTSCKPILSQTHQVNLI